MTEKHPAVHSVFMNMQKTIIRNTGITLLGIIAIAAVTYAYLDLMFSDLEENNLFEDAEIPYFL